MNAQRNETKLESKEQLFFELQSLLTNEGYRHNAEWFPEPKGDNLRDGGIIMLIKSSRYWSAEKHVKRSLYYDDASATNEEYESSLSRIMAHAASTRDLLSDIQNATSLRGVQLLKVDALIADDMHHTVEVVALVDFKDLVRFTLLFDLEGYTNIMAALELIDHPYEEFSEIGYRNLKEINLIDISEPISWNKGIGRDHWIGVNDARHDLTGVTNLRADHRLSECLVSEYYDTLCYCAVSAHTIAAKIADSFNHIETEDLFDPRNLFR